MIKVKVFGSGSKGNGYLIDDGHSQLMIECGVSFKNVQQKMMFDFSKVLGSSQVFNVEKGLTEVVAISDGSFTGFLEIEERFL